MTTTYTATVAIIDPEGNVLLTAGQATDTLAGLIEWGQMTRDDIETPTEPLTVEKVYDFLTQAFSLHKIETLTIEPAPEGTPSTLDDLENFAIRRQEGYEPTEEEFEENGGPPNSTSATRAETSPPSGSNHLQSLLRVPLPALAGSVFTLGVDTLKPRSSIVNCAPKLGRYK